MKRLYEKNELAFALVSIAVYCVLQSLANPLSEIISLEYSANAIFCVIQAVFLYWFMKKNRLLETYGLCKSPVPASRFLYYIPLIVLATENLWNGTTRNQNAAVTVCFISCMLCVGFLEEIIFRGFLFVALAKENEKKAIVISSVSFGLGHLLNLVNGRGVSLADNLFQVTGALVIGFLFVILFYRGKSLMPCILTHSSINITSIFANTVGLTIEKRMVFHLIVIAIAGAYSYILSKSLPPAQSVMDESTPN